MMIDDVLGRWLLDPTVGRLVAVAVGSLLIAAGVRVVHRSFGRYVSDPAVRYRLRKAVLLAGYLTAILFATSVFSDYLGRFTVAFGVAGAGIAFALQEVIASVAGWLAISFGGFFGPGDRIQLGGIRGDVIDVGILRTTLMECGQWISGDNYNGRIVRVANSFVFKEPVFNYSADFPFLWDEIMVPIKYGSDYHLARELILKVAEEVVGNYAHEAATAWQHVVRKYLIEDASVKPVVLMTANQNWIEFTLRYVVDYKLRRTIKDQLFTRILEEVDRTGDRVGIAAATLNIEKLAPLEIRLPARINLPDQGWGPAEEERRHPR
jgi:small-conductance mechanosensitive channel